MDAMVHNTMWMPAHFHLIFGGTVVIVYFASAYALWPKLTGRRLFSRRLAAAQLWLWFVGILALTVPWHYVGLLWMPRRTAYIPVRSADRGAVEAVDRRDDRRRRPAGRFRRDARRQSAADPPQPARSSPTGPWPTPRRSSPSSPCRRS